MASTLRFISKWVLNPRWRMIRRLGDVRILGISLASFIFITLLAKGINYLRNWLNDLSGKLEQVEPVLGEWIVKVSEQLGLPFGLKLLAYSAICAVVAKVIYELACPPYIKVGDSFQHFTAAYSDALSRLCDDFVELWNASNTDIRQTIRKIAQTSHLIIIYFMEGSNLREDVEPLSPDTVTRFIYVRPHSGSGVQKTHTFRFLIRDADFGAAVYDALREHRDASSVILRFLCAMFYYFAIGFGGYAVIYQGWWALPAFTSY